VISPLVATVDHHHASPESLRNRASVQSTLVSFLLVKNDGKSLVA
jgi:hypothetical protein